MDFLDPRKRRSHKIRLIIGYVLVAIAIGLGTIILVYDAYGYGINAKTGDIVQNGLLFVDSKPGGADIYLNGQSKNATTSARLILPAAKYNLTLKKAGYRSWSRTFTLTEHSIERYVYPFLFPEQPVSKAMKTYAVQPPLVTQSPSRQWLLVQTPASSTSSINFDVYDSGALKQPPQPLAVPNSLLTVPWKDGDSLVDTEWSTDNNNLLVQHIFNGGSEFLIINRQNPANSVNLNSLFSTKPTIVALRNKKADQVYIYDQSSQNLYIGDVGRGTLSGPIIKKVLAFKSYGSNLITYITDGPAAGMVTVKIWDNGQSYSLTSFSTGSKYLLDAAQFQNHWYYSVGSDTSDRINIYQDPLDSLKNSSIKKAVPLIALRIKGATKLSFSTNARFIGAQAGQQFAVYDLEALAYYGYTLPDPLISTEAHWMDGHRWLSVSGGKVLVMDYDHINRQSLSVTLLGKGGYFDRDYNNLFTVAPAGSGAGFALVDTDMRAGADLPKP